jgi:hypothetical protein
MKETLTSFDKVRKRNETFRAKGIIRLRRMKRISCLVQLKGIKGNP